MARQMLGQSVRKFAVIACAVGQGFFSAASWGAQSRAYEDFVPAGSLHLGQVVVVGKRDDIVKNKQLYEAVKTTGVDDSEIADGSVVIARIYCCGGMTRESSSEVANSLFLYTPKTLPLSQGDIVEFRVGHPATGGDPGLMNVVTRVVQKSGQDDGTCWWDPRNERLWLRVLYCTWMPDAGWVKQGGISPAWFKPVIPESTTK